jgi:hypothetical protein
MRLFKNCNQMDIIHFFIYSFMVYFVTLSASETIYTSKW